MSPSPSAADWRRLGEQLTLRRVALDPRYQNRAAFCSERGIDYRLAYDIEEARRTNFRRTTLAGIAAAYAVTLDSLYAALGGGELEPLPGARPGGAPPGPAALRPAPTAASAADGPDTVEFLVSLVNRYPDDEALHADILARLVSRYSDDDTMAAIAEVGARRGKPPRALVIEIRDWLAFLDRAEGRRENGASAGLPEGESFRTGKRP